MEGITRLSELTPQNKQIRIALNSNSNFDVY